MRSLTDAQFWGMAAAFDITSYKAYSLMWDWKFGIPWGRTTRGADKLMRISMYLVKEMQKEALRAKLNP